jgi:hypothetical protein
VEYATTSTNADCLPLLTFFSKASTCVWLELTDSILNFLDKLDFFAAEAERLETVPDADDG